MDPAHQLMNVGDDTILTVLVMALHRGLDIDTDAQHKQQAGERLSQEAVWPSLDIEWRVDRHLQRPLLRGLHEGRIEPEPHAILTALHRTIGVGNADIVDRLNILA